jgi:hypothetical protein
LHIVEGRYHLQVTFDVRTVTRKKYWHSGKFECW